MTSNVKRDHHNITRDINWVGINTYLAETSEHLLFGKCDSLTVSSINQKIMALRYSMLT